MSSYLPFSSQNKRKRDDSVPKSVPSKLRAVSNATDSQVETQRYLVGYNTSSENRRRRVNKDFAIKKVVKMVTELYGSTRYVDFTIAPTNVTDDGTLFIPIVTTLQLGSGSNRFTGNKIEIQSIHLNLFVGVDPEATEDSVPVHLVLWQNKSADTPTSWTNGEYSTDIYQAPRNLLKTATTNILSVKKIVVSGLNQPSVVVKTGRLEGSFIQATIVANAPPTPPDPQTYSLSTGQLYLYACRRTSLTVPVLSGGGRVIIKC